jgi:HemY protein
MPLWLAVVCILAIFLMLFALIRFWAVIMKMPRIIKQIKQRRHMQRLQTALECLLSTDWLKAEQHFKKLALSQFLLPYTQLLAASCAAKSHRIHAQEHYVKTARPVLAHETLLLELAKLDVLISTENWQGLLLHIQRLKQQYPGQAGLLRREIFALERLKSWPQLIELLPECKQAHILSEVEYDRLALEAYRGSLRKASRYSPQTMDIIWQTIPAQFQLEPNIVAAYVNHLLKTQQLEQAEALLNQVLEHHSDSVENINLMAQVSLANKSFDKAQGYAEQSLSIKPTAAAYAVLAQIYEKEGDLQKALKTYRQATAVSK